jgi:hypothetical protein
MAKEAQDTRLRLLFPLALQSADRCLGTNFAPIDPGGQRLNTDLCNFFPVIQPASSQIKDIAPLGLIDQYLSIFDWKSIIVLGAAAPASSNHTIGAPKAKQRSCCPRGNIKGRSRRSR